MRHQGFNYAAVGVFVIAIITFVSGPVLMTIPNAQSVLRSVQPRSIMDLYGMGSARAAPQPDPPRLMSVITSSLSEVICITSD